MKKSFRLISGVIDLGIGCILIYILIIIASSIQNRNIFFLVFLGLAMVLSKDVLMKNSIGKRITGLKIIDFNNNLPAKPWQTVIRNSTLIILLPFEIMTVLYYPEMRRIGDLIAGTALVKELDWRKEHLQRENIDETSFFQLSIAIGLAIILIVIEVCFLIFMFFELI